MGKGNNKVICGECEKRIYKHQGVIVKSKKTKNGVHNNYVCRGKCADWWELKNPELPDNLMPCVPVEEGARPYRHGTPVRAETTASMAGLGFGGFGDRARGVAYAGRK